MSTTAILRFNVQDVHDKDHVVTVRLRQYADGYGDFVYPKLEETLDCLQREADISTEGVAGLAHGLAATYESIVNADLPASSRGITARSNEVTNRSFGGDYKYVVTVFVDKFADSLYWSVVGPNEYF